MCVPPRSSSSSSTPTTTAARAGGGETSPSLSSSASMILSTPTNNSSSNSSSHHRACKSSTHADNDDAIVGRCGGSTTTTTVATAVAVATTRATQGYGTLLRRRLIPPSYKRWTEQRQHQIDALNARVDKLTTIAVQGAVTQATKPPQSPQHDVVLDPTYVYAQHPMTVFVAGTPIYQLRSALLVYVYAGGAVGLLLLGLTMTLHSPWAVVLSVLVSFLGYDLYSGILHVVLDHPTNIAAPLLGQPCLEFQWHHAIPDDLVRKHFVDVCGDLNIAVFVLFLCNSYLLIENIPDMLFVTGRVEGHVSGPALLCGGMKILMAYYGQCSHRSAHSFGSKRYRLATWLQHYTLMIAPRAHLSHHKPPHTTDYCLIGVCNPVIDALRTHGSTSNTLWLVLFLFVSLFDTLLYSKGIEYITGG